MKQKIFIIIAILFVIGVFMSVLIWKFDYANQPNFGDLFNSVNALYSGLAFIGVVYAMLLQSEELSLQRKELIETKAQLKRTADAQVSSEKQLDRQNKFNLITAQLNASSTLIDSYQSQINRIYSDPATRNFASLRPKELEDKVSELTKSVQVLLDECNKLKNS